MIVFIMIVCFLAISQFSVFIVYGPILIKGIDLDLRRYTINSFDENIIADYHYQPSTNYISTVPAPILFKYYIKGVGVIPRWTKTHKQIKLKFKELKNKCNEIAQFPEE